MFKVGDEIKIIDENYCGKILEINLNELLILNDFGFEEKYKMSEVISLGKKNDYNLSEKNIEPKDKTIEFKKKVLKNLEIIEVDLHIGNLVDNFNGISNYKMLQIQLKKINETIDQAILTKTKTIIFIHGKGKGVLKKELQKILEERKLLNFFDASYSKYKMGATEIRL